MTTKAQTKKCPFCAETIKAEAIVCRYCGRDLPKDSIGKLKKENQKHETAFKSIATLAAKISGVLTALAILGWVFKSPPSTELVVTILLSTIPTFFTWWTVSAFGIWLYRKYSIGGCVIVTGAGAGLVVGGYILMSLPTFDIITNPTPIQIPSLASPVIPKATRGPILPFNSTPIPYSAPKGGYLSSSHAGCAAGREWENVTSDMDGQVICVQGKIADIEHTDTYIIRFSNSRDKFYLVSFETAFKGVHIGQCIIAEGIIEVSSENVPYINIRDKLTCCSSPCE